MPIKAVIFDMDGVIVDSEGLHREADDIILAKYGVKLNDSEWASYLGQREQEVWAQIKKKSNLKEDAEYLRKEKDEYYLQLIDKKLRLFPGFRTFLGLVKEKNLKIALVSSSPRNQVNKILEKFSLTNSFTLNLSGNDVAHPKPHPEPYQKTIDKLQVKPEECIVIEDTITGIKSAKAAGCNIVAVTNTFAAVSLEKAGADLVVNNLEEISANIIALFGVL